MKKIFSLIAIALMVSCTNEEDTPPVDCNCGIITIVEPNPNNTQWKYTFKKDCNGEFFTFESRVEKLTVGMRTCKK